MSRSTILPLLLALLLPLPATARDAAQLRACLSANLPKTSFEQDIRLDETGGGAAERKLAGTWYWRHQGDTQAGTLRLSEPADLSGAAYLALLKNGKQDFYMYLPALNKVRHVVGTAMAQSLFGSGLSAFDLNFLINGLHGGTLTRISAISENGRPAEQWKFVPPADPNILYDRLDMVIDDAWCLPVRVELYGGVPWKTLALDATTVKRAGTRWTFSRAVLKDLRQGTTTVIETGNEKTDSELPDKMFRPNQFYR